jgi:hypothetical protein
MDIVSTLLLDETAGRAELLRSSRDKLGNVKDVRPALCFGAKTHRKLNQQQG